MPTTKEQVAASIMAVKAVTESIRELKRVPSGVLYAQVMGVMDLATYERIIETLKRVGLVHESAHVLEWSGPTEIEQAKQNSML